MCLFCPKGSAVLEHELVDGEHSGVYTQQPDGLRLVLGYFPESVPKRAHIVADFADRGQVKVLGPGVAVVADELRGSSTASTILGAVVDVFAGDFQKGDHPLEDSFQVGNVIICSASLMNPLLPLLNFPSPYRRQPLASQSAFELLHDTLGHTIKVTVSQRSQVNSV